MVEYSNRFIYKKKKNDFILRRQVRIELGFIR